MKTSQAHGDPENPPEFEDPVLRRLFYDQFHGSDFGGLAGMNAREQEELLLMSGTRKERKAIKARRKAREQAKKQGN